MVADKGDARLVGLVRKGPDRGLAYVPQAILHARAFGSPCTHTRRTPSSSVTPVFPSVSHVTPSPDHPASHLPLVYTPSPPSGGETRFETLGPVPNRE